MGNDESRYLQYHSSPYFAVHGYDWSGPYFRGANESPKTSSILKTIHFHSKQEAVNFIDNFEEVKK